jgi:hypothetical protein
MSPVDVHEPGKGRFYVVCGKCLANSPTVETPDADGAWTAFVALGWEHYQPRPGWRGYARCASCAAKNETVADAVRRAHRSRKSK